MLEANPYIQFTKGYDKKKAITDPWVGLPVSGSAYKELISHPLCPDIKEKAEETEKSTTFPGSFLMEERGRHRANCCSQECRDRQTNAESWLTSAETHEQKPPWKLNQSQREP